MNDQFQIWEKKHKKYNQQDWIDKPSLFSKWVLPFFPDMGKILELGTGHGQDARFFASKGYEIAATDFSRTGLDFAIKKTPNSLQGKIAWELLDMKNGLPFGNSSFNIVYSHLSIQYFNKNITQMIFDDIFRVLKLNGVFVGLFNSINDPEYKTGVKIEDYLYKVPSGMVKRFFDQKSVLEFADKFKPIIIDDKGQTYKDNEMGVLNLIRFVGRKSDN